MALWRNKGHDKTKVPVPLIVGEIFLSVVIVRYMLSFTYTLYTIAEGVEEVAYRAVSLAFPVVMILLVVNSVIGIASAKPTSWRKVMRTTIILLVVNWLRESFGITGVMFDDTFLIVITVLTMAVMMLPSVRRFYLPPMTENPPLTRWIGYIFLMPLFKEADYEFVRGGKEPRDPPAA